MLVYPQWTYSIFKYIQQYRNSMTEEENKILSDLLFVVIFELYGEFSVKEIAELQIKLECCKL